MPFESHEPQVHPTAFVAESATLVGRVTLGENSVVMFGAVVRADRDAITLGEGSNLQDNVVVHGDPGFPARIGAGVSVGHSAVVHGATVEDDCLIGMNATVLNGSVMGGDRSWQRDPWSWKVRSFLLVPSLPVFQEKSGVSSPRTNVTGFDGTP